MGKITNLYQYVNNNLKANITILRQFISSVYMYIRNVLMVIQTIVEVIPNKSFPFMYKQTKKVLTRSATSFSNSR